MDFGGPRALILALACAGGLAACAPPDAPDPDASTALPMLDAVAWTEPAAGDVRDVSWGDREPDGDLDLLVVEHNGAIRFYESAVGELVPAWTGTAEEVGSTQGPQSVAWIGLGTGDDYALSFVVGGDESDLLVYGWPDGELDGDPEVVQRLEGWIDVNAMAVGDADGDGDLDLALARDGHPNAVLRNDGGALGLGWEETAEVGGSINEEVTIDVAWGDADGDGDLDLAFAEYQRAAGFRTFLNAAGTGEFVPGWESAGDDQGLAVAWADADGDGDLDLAATLRGGAGARLYLNDGAGPVDPPQEIAIEGGGEHFGAAWGDADGDGDLDLALSGPEDADLARNDAGDLTHTTDLSGDAARNELESQYAQGAAAWADADGDGRIDLTLGGGEDLPVRILAGAHAGFTCGDRLDASGSPTATAWADWDGDGDPDLAVSRDGRVRVHRNDGGEIEGTEVWASPALSEPLDFAWGDFDGDGDFDLVVPDGDGTLHLFVNHGTGLALGDPVWSGQEGPPVGRVAVADWDLDGDLDVVAARDGGSVTYHANNTPRPLEDGEPIHWSFDNPWTIEELGIGDAGALVVADADFDGDLDVAVGFQGAGSRAVLLENAVANGGPLTPTASWTAPFEDRPTALAFIDLDADGDRDLAVTGATPVRVYEAVSDQLQQGTLWDGPGTGGLALGVADPDRDGRLELAVGTTSGGLDGYVWDPDAGDAVRAWSVSNDQIDVQDVAFADMDGDGDLDLALAGPEGPRVCPGAGAGPDGLTDHPTRVVVLPVTGAPVAPAGHGSLAAVTRITTEVRYLLIDPESDPVPSVRFEVSVDDGATWRPAGTGTWTPGVTDMATSPEGVEHGVQWIWRPYGDQEGVFHDARFRVVAESLTNRRVGGLPQPGDVGRHLGRLPPRRRGRRRLLPPGPRRGRGRRRLRPLHGRLRRDRGLPPPGRGGAVRRGRHGLRRRHPRRGRRGRRRRPRLRGRLRPADGRRVPLPRGGDVRRRDRLRLRRRGRPRAGGGPRVLVGLRLRSRGRRRRRRSARGRAAAPAPRYSPASGGQAVHSMIVHW